MRLQSPPMANPISCVEMTNSHWSVVAQEANQSTTGKCVDQKLTDKVRMLMVEDPLCRNSLHLSTVKGKLIADIKSVGTHGVSY
jgi:hypothetical protein